MFSFIAKRVLTGVLVLLVVSMVTFVLVGLIPGNAARTILGSTASPAAVAQLTRELHLNQPLPVQYWSWLENAVQGHFGTSLLNGESVGSVIASRLQPTLSLVILMTIVSVLSSIFLGVVSALRGGWVARIVDTAGLLGFAIPGFIVALLLIDVFATNLRIFPVEGYVPLSDGIGNWLRALVLPVVALALSSVAFTSKHVRQSMTEVLDSEFIFTLRANGFKHRSVVYKHALRNAIVPALALMGVQLAGAISAVVLIETVFAIPGIGSLAVSATTQGDVPMVLATALFFTAFVVVVNLAFDVLYAVLNPKVRLS
jgi:peptide/nickel transport system permease protein